MLVRYTNTEYKVLQGIEPKPPKQIIVEDRANSPHAGIFQGKNTMFRQLN